MSLLQRKQNYLGVDVGTSSMKLVELANEGGRPRLVTYGYVEETADITKNDSEQARGTIAALLRRLMKESGVTTDRAVAALPSFAVFTSIISLPVMNEKDLLAAIRWEAKKFVPMPLEEMVLDWRLIRAQQQTGGKPTANGQRPTAASNQPVERSPAPAGSKPRDQKILLTAAPRTLVNRYVEVFREAGLRLASLETEAFALERSLLGNDPAPVMVIDIGANATDISIIAHGIPMLNRSIDVGGESFTKAIMRSLNIDHMRAEQFKRDFGMTPSAGNEQIPKALEFAVSSIINEARYCLNLYHNQGSQHVEKIILSGGSAFLAHLTEYLARILNCKVFIGDPWARIIYPLELKPVLQELGPRFTVAIGLAMRDIA